MSETSWAFKNGPLQFNVGLTEINDASQLQNISPSHAERLVQACSLSFSKQTNRMFNYALGNPKTWDSSSKRMWKGMGWRGHYGQYICSESQARSRHPVRRILLACCTNKVLSKGNYCPLLRVIVSIMQTFQNKVYSHKRVTESMAFKDHHAFVTSFCKQASMPKIVAQR